MSHAWLKKYLKMKPEVTKIFEDLEDFKLFCADFGHDFCGARHGRCRQNWLGLVQ
jgi:endonuclease III